MNDHDIVSLYQASATEEPAAELDQRILDYAKSQHKKPMNWLPYVSLAASLALVAVLLPTQWRDQVMPSVEQSRLKATSSLPTQYESVPARTMMKAAPSQRAVNDTIEPQSRDAVSLKAEKQLNAFAPIENLLEQGQTAQARTKLIQLLHDKPELTSQLPDKLKALLDQAGVVTK